MTERFLSDEDLDLRNLTEAELLAWWDLFLLQAQASNDRDERLYSHGVFRLSPPWDGMDLEDIVDPDPSVLARKSPAD